MEFTSTAGEGRYAALVGNAARSVIACDFDGTIAPIVDDPGAARIHPGALDVLRDLSRGVAAVAVITGRPARQVIELGDLEAVGEALAAHGCELYLFGQYGNERWSWGTREVVSPPPPPGLAPFEQALPDLLHRLDAEAAHLERKGLAVAVHTRRLPDAEAAFARLLPAMTELAHRHDLVVEPGRSVIEVRSAGMHKGAAVRRLASDLDPGGFLFAGDDLGDLDAFDAVDELTRQGLDTLLVASSSGEETALVERADVVVEGPEGVLALLARIAEDAGTVD